MHSRSTPRTFIFSEYSSSVESLGDLPLRHSSFDKRLIDVLDHRNLFRRTRHQDDAVSLKAFPFSTPKEALGSLIAVYQLAP